MIFLASLLEPMARIEAAGGPMNTMPACGAGVGEPGILRQEAVARMHRLRAGPLGRVDDLVGHEIALRAAEGPIWTASSAIATWRALRSASE